MGKKKIYIDFDGVLNTYTGWKGENELFQPKEGSEDIKGWLVEYNLIQYIQKVTNIKEPAYAYIDDRAIRFNGDYNKIIQELENFEPYWQK